MMNTNSNPMDPYGAPGVGQAASAYNAYGRGVVRQPARRPLGQPGAAVPNMGTNVPTMGAGGMQIATPPPATGSGMGVGVFGGLSQGGAAALAAQAQAQDEQRRKGVSSQVTP